jgi:hypothetical protein
MMAEDESDAASTVAGDAVDAENSNGSKDNTNFRLLPALPPEIQRTALWPFLSPRDKMRFSGTCKSVSTMVGPAFGNLFHSINLSRVCCSPRISFSCSLSPFCINL